MNELEKLVLTLSRFTPEQMDEFRSAAQVLIEQMTEQDCFCKS